MVAVCEHCESHGKIEFFRCKRSFARVDFDDVIRSFFWLEKGLLPGPGGWCDQSAQWVEAVEIVGREVEEYRAKALETA